MFSLSRDPLITVDMKPLPREPEDEKRKKAKILKGLFLCAYFFFSSLKFLLRAIAIAV